MKRKQREKSQKNPGFKLWKVGRRHHPIITPSLLFCGGACKQWFFKMAWVSTCCVLAIQEVFTEALFSPRLPWLLRKFWTHTHQILQRGDMAYIYIYVRCPRRWRIRHWILWISFFVTEFSARFVALLGESHFFSLNLVTFLTLIFLFL